jgi:Arc/MetJ-type ribon-helix-helix transcriptional regulator
MNLSLSSDIQQFIDEQVKEGRFASPEELIEAAVADMRDADEELDEEDIAAIREADEQGERGEGIDIDEVRAHFAKLYPGAR